MSSLFGIGGGGNVGASGSFYSNTIDNSVRLVGDATPANGGRFTRTFSTVDSATDFTLNFWIKRNDLVNPVNSSYPQFIFNFRDGTSGSALNDLCFLNPSSYGVGASLVLTETNSANYILSTSNLLRDYSSWYNIHIMADMNNGTASERLKFFINGVEATYATDNRSSYTALTGLKAGDWTIGDYYGTAYCIGSSIARWAFVDNSTLAASYFGEFSNGIWVPKAISGITWGSAGHLLNFGQTGTSQDASGIGADTSGQGNHWAVNNIAATDILIDTPTSNFATLNPLYHSGAAATLSEANLKASTGGFVNTANGYGAVSSFAIPKDKKIYIEVECTDQNGTLWTAGFATQSGLESGPSSTTVGGSNAITYYNRSVYVNGSETDYGSSAGLGGLGVPTMAAGDILGCMIDGATGKVWFSRNGSYFKSPSTNNSGTTGDPAGGNHEIGTITNGTTEDVFFILQAHGSTNNLFVNFGQDTVNIASANADANGLGSFEYAPPTDYVCLAASSLPEPTIGPNSDTQADDYFNTVLYTGDSDNDVTVTNTFAADFVWLKKRSASDNHYLQDTVRGFGASKSLSSNTTGTEGYNGGAPASQNIVTTSSSLQLVSSDFAANSATYVAWTWKAGGNANTFNIDGTGYSSASDAGLSGGDITPTGASINTTAGLGIIGYTGDGTSGARTIKHGLSSPPELIFIKDRDTNSNNNQWQASSSVVGDDYAYLSLTSKFTGAALMKPTSGDATTVSVGIGLTATTNESGDDFIMYLFHSVEGYSKIGTYVGSSALSFVYTGFRPAWLMIKRTDSTGSWNIADAVRSPFNEVDEQLQANLTNTESTTFDFDFLSNGFKARTTDSARNANGGSYLYLAFADGNPFKYANAR